MNMRSPLSPMKWLGAFGALAMCVTPAHALLVMSFTRITSKATDNIEGDITLTVTDLGSNMAGIEITRGNTFVGFLRNIYFEDVDDNTIGASFDPVASSSGLMFSDPSDPANPPGIAGFVTKYSFDAESPQPTTKSIGPGETGAYKVDYTGSTKHLCSGRAGFQRWHHACRRSWSRPRHR